MIENEESSSIITAIFEDNSRKRFYVQDSILAKDFIELIKKEKGNKKLENRDICLINEGHIYEEDEPLFPNKNSSSNEISLNIVYHPILNNEKTHSLSFEDFQLILDVENLQELEEIFPNLNTATTTTTRNRNRNCLVRNIKKAFFGFFTALIMGPFSVLILPCNTMDLSTLVGMILGIAAWVFLFMSITTKNPNRNITKKLNPH